MAFSNIWWQKQSLLKVHKNDSFAILLGANFSYRIGGTPINYPWLDRPTIILCSLDKLEAQFWCQWKWGWSYHSVSLEKTYSSTCLIGCRAKPIRFWSLLCWDIAANFYDDVIFRAKIWLENSQSIAKRYIFGVCVTSAKRKPWSRS